MRAAKPIQMRKQGRGRHRFSVNGDRVAALEIDFDIVRLVGRILRIEGARINIIRHFLRGVFQHLAFGRHMKKIGVDRKRRFAALVLGDRDLVSLREGDQRGTRS